MDHPSEQFSMVACLEEEERGGVKGGVCYGCFVAVGAAQRGHSCGMQTQNLPITTILRYVAYISNSVLYLPKYMYYLDMYRFSTSDDQTVNILMDGRGCHLAQWIILIRVSTFADKR